MPPFRPWIVLIYLRHAEGPPDKPTTKTNAAPARWYIQLFRFFPLLFNE